MKFVKAAISVIALALAVSALPIKIEEKTSLDNVNDLTIADIYAKEESKFESAVKNKPFRAYKHNNMETRIEMFGKKKDQMKQQSAELRYNPNMKKLVENIDRKTKVSLSNANRHGAGLTRVKRDQYRNRSNRKHEIKSENSKPRFENNFRMKKIKAVNDLNSRSSKTSVRGL